MAAPSAGATAGTTPAACVSGTLAWPTPTASTSRSSSPWWHPPECALCGRVGHQPEPTGRNRPRPHRRQGPRRHLRRLQHRHRPLRRQPGPPRPRPGIPAPRPAIASEFPSPQGGAGSAATSKDSEFGAVAVTSEHGSGCTPTYTKVHGEIHNPSVVGSSPTCATRALAAAVSSGWTTAGTVRSVTQERCWLRAHPGTAPSPLPVRGSCVNVTLRDPATGTYRPSRHARTAARVLVGAWSFARMCSR